MSRDRYPRTLNEAFGPYTSPYFEPEPRWCFFRSIGFALLRLLRGAR